MTKKPKKAKKTPLQQLQTKLLKGLTYAIDQAVDDTGLDPKNYGMLEERVRWYLDEIKFDLGYVLEIRFNHKKFQFEITKMDKIVDNPQQG